MAEPSGVLLLVGLGPDSSLPLAVRERADAALLAARAASVRVVEAVVSANGATGSAGPAAVLPADGRIDEGTLARLTPDGSTSVAVAGAPTHELLAGLGARLEGAGSSLVVLDDACVILTAPAVPDGGPDDGAPPAEGRRAGARTASISTDEWASAFGGRRRPTRRRVVGWVALAVAVVIIISIGVWSNHEAGGYYTLSPGSAPLLTTSGQCVDRGDSGDLSLPSGQPCARVVVPAANAHGTTGSLFMVDVLEGRTTWSDYLLDKLGLLHTFRDGSQLLPASSILGSTPPDQLQCQNDQEMVQAQTDAPVAALQRLGYDVHEKDFGAQVDLVIPNFPAASAGIACNDLITSIDGQPVATVQDVSRLLSGHPPGATVALGVTSPDAKTGTAARTVNVKLAATPAEQGAAANPKQGFLGVELETRSTYELPVNVSVQVGNIGGPSAGLALTLAIMDVLSNGKLTGGHQVAATGTIAPDGTVGDVGGVAQKTVAVRRAGATLFLVPPQELAVARSEAGSSLKVVAVSSLTQALAALQAIGGQIPPPPSS